MLIEPGPLTTSDHLQIICRVTEKQIFLPKYKNIQYQKKQTGLNLKIKRIGKWKTSVQKKIWTRRNPITN